MSASALLPLLLILLHDAAGSGSSGFSSKQQYEYLYEGVQKSGVPRLGSQWSAAGLRCHVSIQAATDQILYVKLGQLQYGEYHGKTDDDQQKPSIEYSRITEFEDALGKPFKVEMSQGKIQKLITSAEEDVWVTNIKKSIVQMLQLDLKEQGSLGDTGQTASPASSQRKTARLFRVMETGISGDCETLYEVMPHVSKTQQKLITNDLHKRYVEINEMSTTLPEHPFFVHKTKQFDNCRQKPIWSRMSMTSSCKSGNKCRKSVVEDTTMSSYSRYLLDGHPSDFTIHEISSESRVVMNPHGLESEQLWTSSKQSLLLKSKQQMKTFFGSPREPKVERSLVFKYPTADGSPLPLPDLFSAPQVSANFPGTSEPLVSPLRPQEKVQYIVDSMKAIEEYLDKPADKEHEYYADYLIGIEEAMSYLSYNKLEEVLKEMKTPRQIEMFYDMLAVTGSNPAVMMIVNLIEHGQLTKQHACSVISTLPRHVKTPTPQLIQQLMQMRKSIQVQESQELQLTLSLALGNMFNKICAAGDKNDNVEHDSRFRVQICGQDMLSLMTQYVEQMNQEIHQRSEPEKLAYIQTLGNIGHKNILESLKVILKGDNSKLVASKAVYALYKLARVEPQEVRDIVSPLVHDTTRQPEVRQAAITVLLATDPPLAYWQKLALSSWREPSEQVISFISSAFKSYLNEDDDKEDEMSRKARVSLSMTRQTVNGWSFSKKHDVSSVVSKLIQGGLGRMSYITGTESPIPNTVYAKIDNIFKGMIDGQGKLIMNVDGIQTMIDDAMKLMTNNHNRRRWSRDMEDMSESMRKVLGQLGTSGREMDPESPILAVYSSWMGSVDRFFQVNAGQYDRFKASMLRSDPRKLRLTQKIMYLSDKTVTVPSEMGFPVVCSLRSPAIMSVQGDLEAQWDIVRGSYRLSLANARPMLAVTNRAVMNFMNPFSGERIGAGVDKGITAHLPFNVQMNLDLKSRKLETVVELIRSESNKDVSRLLHVHVLPFTIACRHDKPSHSIQMSEVGVKLSGLPNIPPKTVVVTTSDSVKPVKFMQDHSITVRRSSDWGKIKDSIRKVIQFRSDKPIHSGHMDLNVAFKDIGFKKLEITVAWKDKREGTQASDSITSSLVHKAAVSESFAHIRDDMQDSPAASEAWAISMTSTLVHPDRETKTCSGQMVVGNDRASNKRWIKFRTQTSLHNMCSRIQLISPEAASDDRSEDEQLHAILQGDLGVGQTSCRDHTLSLDGRISSAEHSRWWQMSSAERQRCLQDQAAGRPASPVCVKHSQRRSLANHLSLKLDMTNFQSEFPYTTPIVDNALMQIFGKFSSGSEYRRGENGKVEVSMKVESDEDTFSLIAQTPSQKRYFSSIPMPFSISKETTSALLSMRKPLEDKLNSLLYGEDKTICSVGDSSMKTFDGRLLNLLPSSCHTVLAHCPSCPEKLVIVGRSQPDQREVRILLADQDLVMKWTRSSGAVEVEVNGQQQRLQPGEPLKLGDTTRPRALIWLWTAAAGGRDELEVELPEHWSRIRVDGDGVQVRMSPLIYRGRVLGLCGDMNGERTADLIDSQSCVHTQTDSFQRSFQVTMGPDTAAEPLCQPHRLPPSTCARQDRLYTGF